MDELTLSASDNDDVPDEPTSFIMEWVTIDYHAHVIQYHKHIPRFKWVRDELIFNPSDNDNAPESPILFLMERITIDNHVHVMK